MPVFIVLIGIGADKPFAVTRNTSRRNTVFRNSVPFIALCRFNYTLFNRHGHSVKRRKIVVAVNKVLVSQYYYGYLIFIGNIESFLCKIKCLFNGTRRKDYPWKFAVACV